MNRAGLGVCALGGVLLVLAGCSSLDLGFDLGSGGGGGVSGTGNVRIMDGSPETVAVTLKDTLTKRGLKEITIAKGATGADGTVVQAKTAGGLACAFLLKSVPGTNGREQTHIELAWMGLADQNVTVQLLADVDRQGGTKK